ncbi:hypothetical protein RUM43_004943 [Polyplax serrata]|uniref:Uncharacterized protein n=1 Tax=Polyplax serrata TaxID=468196 RepID=A0AAN8SBD2_POLSC
MKTALCQLLRQQFVRPKLSISSGTRATRAKKRSVGIADILRLNPIFNSPDVKLYEAPADYGYFARAHSEECNRNTGVNERQYLGGLQREETSIRAAGYVFNLCHEPWAIKRGQQTHVV